MLEPDAIPHSDVYSCTIEVVKQLNASEFRASCLALLDDLPKEGVVILKRGRPVAKLVPIVQETSAHLIGALKGKFKILGDTMSTDIKWEAES